MNSNTKKILILLILGMGFVFLHNIKLEFGHRQKSNVIIPKESGVYSEHFIHIDGSIANNWSYTVANYTWCSGDGSWGNPYIIENVTVDCGGTGNGIFIDNSKNDYFKIRNCTVFNSGVTAYDAGIKLEDTCNGTLFNNNCSNNGRAGILLYDNCNNNTISGNTAINNFFGIYLYECDYNTVSGNTANDNDYGIYIEISNDNTISGNTANENSLDGIYSYFCGYNNITENTANNNDANGIYFEGDDKYNVISGNTLSDNKYGINIGNSDNNTIYGNFFLTNGIHAMDNGTDNKWNSTTIGNYWDNHTTPDVSPQDGIVDEPYTYIGGSTGSIDYLPIAEDGAPTITIHSPSAGSSFGSSAPSFNVEVNDDYLFEMWYTLDGGLNNYTFTENGTIDQSAWDALGYGSVTITFYANDLVGNEAFEEVTISKSVTVEGPDSGDIIFIVVLSIVAGVAVVAGVYLYMKKRTALE